VLAQSVKEFAMSRNGLYGLVIVLVIVLIGLGFYIYQQQTRPGIEMRVDGNGVSIQGNP
jgi:hypothetical protein